MSGGTVYERDFLSISGPGLYTNTERPLYQDSNFRFVVRSGVALKHKHKQGNWAETKDCDNYSTQWWTVECLNGDGVSDQSKIIANPDYTSLKDFAYYGSATDLIRATMIDIALKFPAEIYFTTEKSKYSVSGLPSGTYFIVDNPFNIDLHSQKPSTASSVNYNKYRYLCDSWQEYNGITSWATYSDTAHHNQTLQPLSCYGPDDCVWICDVKINGQPVSACYIGGEIKYLYKSTSLQGIHCRPNSDAIKKACNEFNDFEKVLLNIDIFNAKAENSSLLGQKYRAVFDTPYFTDDGYFTNYEEYVWPSKYGWNPDMSGQAYQVYIDRLLKLAEFHDEYDSDNIWRSMTHEAIKNLDWSFTRQTGDMAIEYTELDTTRIEPMLKLYGRQYDEIKRQIDNIGRMNNISYDKKNNAPDYFIDELLFESGWEPRALDDAKNNTKFNVTWNKSGLVKYYTTSEASDEVLRILKINSRYLLSKKGTRDGVRELLGLFGFTETTGNTVSKTNYKLSEYHASFNSKITYSTAVQYNSSKINFNEDVTNFDELQGIPVAATSDGYVIPWYDQDLKYDGGLYYQMNGGWKKEGVGTQWRKDVVNPINKTAKITLSGSTSSTNSNVASTFYDETLSTMKVVARLADLLEIPKTQLRAGEVCYVEDITDLGEMYNAGSGDDTIQNNTISDKVTHYFVLGDIDLFATLGVYTGTTSNPVTKYGWVNIPSDYFKSMTVPTGSTVFSSINNLRNYGAAMSAYLEDINSNYTGNNPHAGYGIYDDGFEYLERLRCPFLGAYKEGLLPSDITSEDQAKGLCNFGSLNVVEDSTKIIYYDYPGIQNQPSTITGIDDAQMKMVNIKNLDIVFNSQSKDFVTTYILPFVEQMIPSTAIFRCIFK